MSNVTIELERSIPVVDNNARYTLHQYIVRGIRKGFNVPVSICTYSASAVVSYDEIIENAKIILGEWFHDGPISPASC